MPGVPSRTLALLLIAVYWASFPTRNWGQVPPVFAGAGVAEVSGAGDAEDGKMFQQNCTTCHDSKRSLDARKTLEGWRATVQKMAAKEDANIPIIVREPIAQYLARHAGLAGGQVPGPMPSPEGVPGSEKAAEKGKDEGQKFDPALVQQGTSAFNAHCTTCHSADKSFQATKSLPAWRSTVRRMSEKDGANIPENTHESIAVYLASLSAGKGGTAGGGGEEAVSPVAITGTLSPTYRYSGRVLEDPGHFGDAWLGVAWQGKGPVSARVTSCVSCHSQGLQLGNSIEMVEAAVRFDVSKALCKDPQNPPLLKASVEAGRFVVPFGAYYQQVNPGVDRAVARPLIYNMGQRVNQNDIGDPVLPMPYCDQGASINLAGPVGCNLNSTFNAYVVNGLKGSTEGISFFQSRDYSDNNPWPAGGGRATIGGERLRFGCSLMGGRFDSYPGFNPQQGSLNYVIFGADATYHWEDVLRVQFEFAQRNSDRFDTLPGNAQASVFTERVSGFYLEAELLVLRQEKVSLFARFDEQYHDSPLPVLGSQVAASSFGVTRVTLGVNWTLPGGSLLMVNGEHWDLPNPLGHADVLGMRWAATF